MQGKDAIAHGVAAMEKMAAMKTTAVTDPGSSPPPSRGMRDAV